MEAGSGSEIFVAGSFNDWDPRRNKLADQGGGLFRLALLLPRGSYEYKFVVNGLWQVDPKCPDWVPNNLGSLNSVIRVD
jgi:1,4-alpha-glucan branching enzyme